MTLSSVNNAPHYFLANLTQFIRIVKVKLTSIKLNGVPGHGEINLTDINRLSVFTGPNGSGKSTALNAIKLALEILHAGGVHDTFKSDKEITFSEASLSFTCPGRTYTSNTAALFKSGIQNISIKLLRDADTYSIVSVSSQESLFLETIEHTTADIKAQHDQIKSMEIEESNIRANIAKKERPVTPVRAIPRYYSSVRLMNENSRQTSMTNHLF